MARQAVLRRLQDADLMSHFSAKAPLISKKNIETRLNFANNRVLWTEAHWKTVFFSDEIKFNMFRSDGKQYVGYRTEERFDPKCT